MCWIVVPLSRRNSSPNKPGSEPEPEPEPEPKPDSNSLIQLF